MRNHIAIVCTLASWGHVAAEECPAAEPVPGVMSNNPKFSGTCQVYKQGEGPCVSDSTPLGEGVGWLVVVGFGFFFTMFTVFLSRYEYKTLGTDQSSEQFNTAGRNVGPGLTAAVIVSQWTWAATLLMSSNMGWRVGVSGPFWYASGATIQILLFAILAIQVKRRASHMHTFMEIVKARFGTFTHIVMIVFALTTNVIVTSMLLLGGASTIEDLTGMSKLTAAFLIPILSCWIYTMYGGLRATFFASYVHTTVIFIMLLTFTFAVYSGSGEHDLWGSPSNVYNALEKATVHGFFDATYLECSFNGDCNAPVPNVGVTSAPTVDPSCPTATAIVAPVATNYMTPTGFFDGMTAIMLNDGVCYNKKREKTGVKCGYVERGKDSPCCNIDFDYLQGGTYCRANDDLNCISTSADKHFESKDQCGEGELCVTSFLTMGSTIGLIFGITNIVGNFGTVFVDQSYWQSAVAAKPRSAVVGFLIGGMVWFAVPFCMATTNGLAGRALTTHPNIEGNFGAYYIDAGASSAGLTPARVLSHILGPAGAFILLLQLFMAITSTGSAEIIAVSSILTYDIYYEYINPELKMRREKLRRTFYTLVQKFVTGSPNIDIVAQPDKEPGVRLDLVDKTIKVSDVQSLLDSLAQNNFFDVEPSQKELDMLASLVATFATADGNILVPDLYSAVNKAVSSNNIEGAILLRVSKFFTGLFAVFMGFLAVFLLTIGLSLGHVYMSMGCIVGCAVGPAALTILMETANGKAIAVGALGGFVLAMIGWIGQAAAEFGKVEYGTLMSDWPWVVGNLCGILGGTAIAWLGSVISPDKSFKWSMLNDRIALVDDVEPPKDSVAETDQKLEVQVKIAVWASIGLTIILLVLWPIPMHVSTGVFSEGSFSAWVSVEIIWALLGGIVIIILPLIELIRTFTGKDKAVFKEGTPLKYRKQPPMAQIAQKPIEEVMKEAKEMCKRDKANISAGPPAESKLIEHPAVVVRIGVRRGPKAPSKEFDAFKKMYGDDTLYSLTEISADGLADIDPTNFDLIFDMLPAKEHNAQELDTMLLFLQGGGHLMLIGEHCNYAPDENKRITKFVFLLGGAVIVAASDVKTPEFTAADASVNDIPLTSGITSFKTARWASLEVDDKCDIVFADTGKTDKIMMADFHLCNGRVTVAADINTFTDNNKPFYLNMAHRAKNSKMNLQ